MGKAEILASIREKEAALQSQTEAARGRARESVNAARRKAQKMREDGQAESDAQREARLLAARETATGMRKETLARGAAEARKMKSDANYVAAGDIFSKWFAEELK